MLSVEVDEFTQIGDELTDVGGMKVLLTKLRFFEKEWDLQEMVSLVSLRAWVINGSGLHTRFRQPVPTSFQPFRRGDHRGVLSVKLQSGESDSAGKMLKFSDVPSKKLCLQYRHFKLDNHVNETAWEEVQKVRKV